MASDARVTAIIEAKDEASGTLNKVSDSFMGFSSKTVMLGAAFTAVGAAAFSFGEQALKAAANWEQVNVAFTTMLGSADDAKVFMNDLVQFAKSTPFTLSGLQQASKQLLAYGFAQKEVIPNLEALGNIAAGVGMDKLPNLILAFGQVKAATRLTGMELRQFTEAGVPLLDTLSKQFGKPVSAIQDMVSAGEIGFPAVEQAIKSLSAEGGRFNNLMEKQSHTLSGMVSNLGDAWNIFLTQQGAFMIEWAKQLVGLATAIVVGFNNVNQIFADIGGWIESKTGLITYFQGIWLILSQTFTEKLLPALKEFWAALQPLMPFFSALGTVIGATLVGALVLFVNTITGAIVILSDFLVTGIKVATFFTDVFGGAITFVIDKVSDLIRLIEKAVAALSRLTSGKSITGSVGSAIKNMLPSFDKGGIVGGPIGAPQLAIVHGGERVVPNGSTGGGTGIVVNITGNNISSALDIRDLADAVGKEMMRSLNRAQMV